jgi:hypothetical protein
VEMALQKTVPPSKATLMDANRKALTLGEST